MNVAVVLSVAQAASAADPVIAAAGDIACDPTSSNFNGGLGTATLCRQKATSDLLVGGGPAAILPLGDLQYECGGYSAFLQSYDPSWGRVKAITHPAIGNHEYTTTGGTDCDTTGRASGYFNYFNGTGSQNGLAGDRTKGYYSFNLGTWHVIALNSNCSIVRCSAGSAQEQWLRQDLAANAASCTLAYWHHPLFTSGTLAAPSVKPLFQALYDYRADLVLSGHDHNYERFAPQDANGTLDLARGIRDFVVGTGGKSHHAQGTPIPNSEARNSDTFGILKLTLHPTGFDWNFVPEAGKTFTDRGTDTCDGTAPDSTAPAAPTSLTASAFTSTQVDLSWKASTDNVGVTSYEIYRNGTLIKRTASAVTSYSNTGVAGGNTYRYQVKARDAAGNVSAGSNVATVTTPINVASVKVSPEADARVQEANPSTNYGTSSNLRVDGGSDPDVDSYLRFTVTGVAGPVQSAKLRVFAYTATVDGPAAYTTSNTWTETGITWANRPARTSAATDDKGAITANTWVEFNVKPFIAGNGTYSFALGTTSSDGMDMYSREATGNRPELIVSFSS